MSGVYTIEDMKQDIPSLETPNADIDPETLETEDLPEIKPPVDREAFDRSVERTANKLAGMFMMLGGIICRKFELPPLDANDFQDFKTITEDLIDLHPGLAKGGRLLTYLDVATALPTAIYIKGVSAPKQQTQAPQSKQVNPKKEHPKEEAKAARTLVPDGGDVAAFERSA